MARNVPPESQLPRSTHRYPSMLKMNAAQDSGEPLLELRGASKSYGDTVALAPVDLEVRVGETLALIGESGSGKSTLIRLFNRLVEPTSGDVMLGGRPSSSLDAVELRRHIGYVQQDGGLLPHWTVRRNVELVPELLGWDLARRHERSRELLDIVGLEASTYASRYPLELSGGQRQRVAFARALAGDPDLVLLDEPFGALDAITRADLHDQFMALKQRFGKTTILVTHDLAEAFKLADRIGVLKSGRLLQIGTRTELAEQPSDPYVERLLTHISPQRPC